MQNSVTSSLNRSTIASRRWLRSLLSTTPNKNVRRTQRLTTWKLQWVAQVLVNGAMQDRVFYKYEYPILQKNGVKIDFKD